MWRGRHHPGGSTPVGCAAAIAADALHHPQVQVPKSVAPQTPVEQVVPHQHRVGAHPRVSEHQEVVSTHSPRAAAVAVAPDALVHLQVQVPKSVVLQTPVQRMALHQHWVSAHPQAPEHREVVSTRSPRVAAVAAGQIRCCHRWKPGSLIAMPATASKALQQRLVHPHRQRVAVLHAVAPGPQDSSQTEHAAVLLAAAAAEGLRRRCQRLAVAQVCQMDPRGDHQPVR